MKIWVLGSGSRGNAVLVDNGACRVMIDIGFGPRILTRRLQQVGVEPESVDACIVTHEHSDHIRGAARAARRWHWPLFMTEGTYRSSRLSALGDRLEPSGTEPGTGTGGVHLPFVATTFAAGRTLEFPDLVVETFRTPHDGAEPIGVVVTSQRTGARAAVLTDIGCASRTVRTMVRDVDVLVVESNHDEQMLWNGSYPLSLQRRIASRVGHLSNGECADLVRSAVTPRLRQVVLAHLSEENNTPRLAYDSMRDALKQTGFRGALSPALQDSPAGPFTAPSARRAHQLSFGL